MQREHFSRHYDNELNEIRTKLLEMGGKVESTIVDAMNALVNRDSALAEKIKENDHVINGLEMAIDEKCLHVLATRQPAARDLRFITLALKIVTDLERMGDQCVSIARRAEELSQEPPLKPYVDLPRMADAARNMVKEALDAFVRGDEELAMKVCRDDDFVDNLNVQIQRELLTFMMEDPRTISRCIKINAITKAVERIADHATNISEMVIFMIKGKDIRHTAV